jgi:hypothetical protein
MASITTPAKLACCALRHPQREKKRAMLLIQSEYRTKKAGGVGACIGLGIVKR